MANLKKILGMLARLLLAAGAEKWKQGQGMPDGPALKVQALASMSSASVAAIVPAVVAPEKYDPPVVVKGGAVAIPGDAPATVVEVVQPPYQPAKSAEKAGQQAWLVILALVGNSLVDALTKPGVLESLPLPLFVTRWAPVPIIFAALVLLRDWVRHRQASK